MKRVLVTGAALAALAGVGAFLAQPASLAARPAAEPKTYEVWVPPGEYRAFVFNSNANTSMRRWIVTIESRGNSFPVSIPAGETVVIPFEAGWKITTEDNVHIRSVYVPFSNMRDLDPLPDQSILYMGAWGIGPRGPVEFVPPREKNVP